MATTVPGKREQQENKVWFDEESHNALKHKAEARMSILKDGREELKAAHEEKEKPQRGYAER